jgi:TolB-like protein/DNA-binding winged helix-turn-helix (wHTH) protein/tetratricopeptide (TPR) repeat protein
MVSESHIVRFGAFEADLSGGELRKQGIKVALQEQPFRVLAVLLEHPGEVVSRERLQQTVWGSGTFVDFDHGLNTAIKKIRECLRDTATHPRFIETVPKHGYRFVAPVDRLPYPASEATAAEVADRELSYGRAQRSKPLGLSWRSGILAVGAVCFAVVMLLQFRPSSTSTQSRPHTAETAAIAVLPFVNLTPGKDDEYLSDGLTDEVINTLSKVPTLRVIGRTSAFQFKGKTDDVRRIGERLNVEAVLEGTVRRSGDRIRITAQLVSARNGYQLWSESYDRQATDAFEIQTTIAKSICQHMRIHGSRPWLQRTQVHSPNHRAVDAYLKARYLAHQRTANALTRSIELFRQAIAQDPGYALAYSGLANSFSLQVAYNLVPTSEAAPRIKAAALKALALDDTIAEAHVVLGGVKVFYDWDWPGGEQEELRAIELEPRLATARQRYALHLMWMGRFDEALNHIRLAQELDPLSPVFHMNEGEILYNARQYNRAIEHCRRVKAELPNFFQTHRILGDAYVAVGMYPEAIAEFTHALSDGGENPVTVGSLGYAHGVAGNREQALRLLRSLQQQPDKSWFAMARIYLAVGETGRALEMLEKCYENRCREMMFLRVHPNLDPLRSHPKFSALVARVPLHS